MTNPHEQNEEYELALLLGNGCCINEEKPEPCSTCRYTAGRVIELGYTRHPTQAVMSFSEIKESMKTYGGDDLEDWLLNEMANAIHSAMLKKGKE